MERNVEIGDGFGQVCLWPAISIRKDSKPGPVECDDVLRFEKYFLDELDTRVQFLEMVVTNPELEGGVPVGGTGGRIDIVFSVHDEDVITKFALARLEFGIRWIEDALSNCNNSAHMYPDRFRGYMSWDPDPAAVGDAIAIALGALDDEG